MHISILTLFPEMFSGPFDYSIVKRASNARRVTINYVNIRDFAIDRYRSVDDHPYGGGSGMILRVDVVDRALASLWKATKARQTAHVVLLDPKGEPYRQEKARELAKVKHLVLVCGHYEGIDERIRLLVDETVSVGDYILTGGEIPAMAVVDSVVRLLTGVLKNTQATSEESFSRARCLEYPQYTRPEQYKGHKVPGVLLTGDHQKIANWRNRASAKTTRKLRPDLAASDRRGI